MSAAVAPQSEFDRTDFSYVLQASIKLGLIQSVLVLAYSLVTRFLGGLPELVVNGLILAVGSYATIVLPGVWTRARTIEGVAGAAGIGLGAALVFNVVDLALLRWIGTYTHRFLEIGGGSNWWYHPIWWQVGAFVPWMGALWMANSAAKSGRENIGGLLAVTVIAAAGFTALFSAFHIYYSGWNLGTFGTALIPGVAVAGLISMIGVPRSAS